MAQARLLGLRTSDAPFDGAALVLRSGLTVLYGLNGAGKTRLLASLSMCLAGRRSGDPLELPRRRRSSVLFGSIDLDHAWVGQCLRDAIRVWDWRDPETEISLAAVRSWAQGLEHTALATEAARQGTFGFVPVGRGDPRWEVWLCSVNDGTNPAFDSALHELAGRWAPVERAIEAHGPMATATTENGLDALLAADHHARQAGAMEHPLLSWYWHGREAPNLVGAPLAELLPVDGLPLPIAQLGTVERIPWSVVFDPDHSDARSATLRGDFWHADDWDLQDYLDNLSEWAEAKSRQATAITRQFLLDAPQLLLRVDKGDFDVRSDALTWVAEEGDRQVPLSHLSRAEQKWAAFGITLANLPTSENTVWLLDEPEAALHRSAEAHMAKGLVSLARTGGYWIAATHSPELLDDPRDRLLRVHKHSATSRILPLSQSDFDDLSTLGLTPAELLRRWRVVLLVEGHHEELIMRETLGDRLIEARVKILPVRGARELAATVESRLLYDYTDARIVPVIDNMASEHLRATWEAALVLATTDGPGEAAAFVRRSLPAKESAENKFMQQFLSRALDKGRTTSSRVTPFSFSKPDITDYLPLDLLLPERPGKTWAKLRKEHASQSGDQPVPFKAWVEKAYGKPLGRAIFNDDAIREAARSMTTPEEFDALLQVCRDDGFPHWHECNH